MVKGSSPPEAGSVSSSKVASISAKLRPLRVRSAPLEGPSWQDTLRTAGHPAAPEAVTLGASLPQLSPASHRSGLIEASSQDASPCRHLVTSGVELPAGEAVQGLPGTSTRGAVPMLLQPPETAACCGAQQDDGSSSSSTSSECSASQHHATDSLHTNSAAVAAWLADHGQVTLADVEEASTPIKRFGLDISSPSRGSEDSWHGLEPAQAGAAHPAPGGHGAFPYIAQPFDLGQAGGQQRAMQALNTRLQHGVLDAHARQRAMRRDMRAATCDYQASHAAPPLSPAHPPAAFPGPPQAPHPTARAEASAPPTAPAAASPDVEATAARNGRDRPSKMMRLGPLAQDTQQTIATGSGKGRIRIARMVF